MRSSLLLFPLALFLSAVNAAPASEPVKPASPTAASQTPAAQTTTYFADDPVKWASPEVVLPPTYPPAALAKGVTAVVDATLNLKATGRLDSIVSMQSEPKDATFESAVEAVLKHWRFAQSLDASCRPIPAVSRVRVWFEIKDGQPSISVTHVPGAMAPGTVGIKSINRSELTELIREGFPRDARIDGVGADVYAKLSVDPRTGVTQRVDIVTISGKPSIFERSAGSALTTQRPPTIAIQFGIAARTALMQARFVPGAVGGEAPIHVCFLVNYQISDKGE